MGREIERKFLVTGDEWRALAVRSARMRQGYLASSDGVSVRVRLAGGEGALNIKAGGLVAARDEFEYPIPAEDAREMLGRLCRGPLVEKTRHYVPYEDHTWEIDEFEGANAGLVVAEIELEHEAQEFGRPAWIGREVTQLARYYNVELVDHPYAAWSPAERRGE